MRPIRQISAAQMAMLSLFGSLLAGCGCLVHIPHFEHTSTQMYTQIAISLALTALGLTILFKASATLENGIAASRWPEEEIEALRIKLESPMLPVLSFGILFASIILMLALPRHGSGVLAGTILVQGMTRLRYIMRRSSDSRPRIDWQNNSPIQSQHWGNR
jgi:hypothetical protein